jgi:predicted glycosyltransferase
MNILIEVGHPNDVHQFKHLYIALIEKDCDVLFLAKKKDIVIELMDAYKLPYKVFAKTPNGLMRKLLTIPLFNLKYFLLANKFKPNIILSRNSPHSAHYAFLKGIPHFGFADTENSGFADKLAVPFIKYFFTSTSYRKTFPRYHFRYPGYIETWYLHPRRFSPNPSVLKMLGVDEGEKFFILRFVSWQAHHDRGLTGLSDEFKIRLVNLLLEYGKVFISSEKPLPLELEQYRFSLSPQYMHDALYYASIFYGESATMASECAMMGTPAYFLDPIGRGYTSQQENLYGLVNNYSTTSDAIESSLISLHKELKNLIKTRENAINLNQLLDEVIDPISFCTWLIINFPASMKEIINNPDKIKSFK